MKKDTKILAIMLIGVIVIVVGILAYKQMSTKEYPLEVMQCIASQSQIFSNPGCSHCIAQEKTLGKYYSLFNVTNCVSSPEICLQYEVRGTPTWWINGTKYEGAHSVEELKEFAGC